MRIVADSSQLMKIAKELRNSPALRKDLVPYFKDAVQGLYVYSFQEAPHNKGQLEKSIEVKHIGELTSTIGSDDAKCPYAKFVYLGTKKHRIMPKNKKALAFVPKGSFDSVLRKGVLHPGTKPNPYLMRSFERHKDEFIANIETGIKEVLEGV